MKFRIILKELFKMKIEKLNFENQIESLLSQLRFIDR